MSGYRYHINLIIQNSPSGCQNHSVAHTPVCMSASKHTTVINLVDKIITYGELEKESIQAFLKAQSR